MNSQRIFFIFIYSGLVLAFSIGLALISLYALGPPPLEDRGSALVVSQNGQVISDKPKEITEFNDLPTIVVDGILVAEDQHFFDHFGFDFRGIARAIIRNIKAGALKEGASTITQQLARNLYLSHEKTWTRKLKELYYTLRLEMFYDKEQLLTAYVNTIYFGHGAYGLEAASTYYFDKPIAQLSLAETALLIGIPRGPAYYSPHINLENAIDRQRFILKRLLDKASISEADYALALQEELEFKEAEVTSSPYAYFIDYVWQEIEEKTKFKRADLEGKDITIETTLDLSLQKESNRQLESEVLQETELEVGMIALDPLTGAIKQMTGGKRYEKSSFNRALFSKRMVGSTFKPFVYYAALEQGFTATTKLQSEPTTFAMGKGDVYEPSNYNEYYAYKPITLAQALALSDNIYAVKTHLFLSPPTVSAVAKQFGIQAQLPEVASLALGSASIPLIEMVQAYATIANGGFVLEPYAVEKIESKDGKILYEKKKNQAEKVFDEKKMFILAQLMTGMFDRRLNGYMEVTGSSIIDQLHNHEFAGKSGTTDADSWMIGFSPKLVIGTWTGYDDNEAIKKLEEKAYAKQLWANMMEFAHQREEEALRFPIPEGIVSKVVDVETGLLATEDCVTTRTTYFEAGTEPRSYCTNHIPEHDEDELLQEEKENFWDRMIEFLP